MPLPLLNSAARPLDCLHPQDVHVLLVDDEQLSRLVVGNLLRKCDYKVTVVESGAQALDVLRQSVPGTFQLILTDVMMPEVDGLDILRYVRSNAQLADLPVIMMSANEQKDAVFEAIKGGAEEYLVKPVTKKEVQNIWQHVWKRLSARTLQCDSSWPDLQALQGNAGDDTPALANGLPSGNTNSSQQQQRRQQQGLMQSMQQLHHAQQQIVQQPDPSFVRRPQQQQQRQQQVLLSQWLQRPKRVVNPKECTWVFCEVLLLLRNMAAACSNSSGGQGAGVPSGFVRPSRLLLHSNGRVTAAAAGAATDPQEEAVYASPQELAAAAASGSSHGPPAFDSLSAHSYSLGVLFFDLLYAAPSGSGLAGRWKALSGLQHRIMPPAFLQQYPQEAALLLSLLHPEPAARPSLQQLLSSELLSAYCEALQERHRQQQGRDPDSLVFFLDMMQGRKQAEVQQVQQTVSQLDAQIAAVEAALREMQGSRGQGVLQQEQQQQGADGHWGSARHAGCSTGVCGSGEAAVRGGLAAVAAAVEAGMATPAAASPAVSPADPPVAAPGDDMDEDDLEMERRERGRNKRRRIAAGGGGPMQLQQQLLLERSGSANSANAAAASADAAITPSAAVVGKWERVADRFPVLEGVYLKHSHSWEKQQDKQQQEDGQPQQQQQQQGSNSTQPAAVAGAGALSNSNGGLALPGCLRSFGEDLWAYSRYSGLAVRGTVRAAADVLGGGSAMVCAAAFDRDDEYVATAGVSKRIRIFEYASITSSACGDGCGCTAGKAAAPGMGGFSRGGFGDGVGSPLSPSASAGMASSAAPATGVDGIVYPVLELNSRSRLSCVVWSSYVKAHIASSDYEGVVQLWDANTGGELVQFEEHAKRAWAVDFSRLEPTRLVSSSDDCTVKLWSIHQESSLATLQLHANVCSVQFSPESPHLLACGCANYRTYLYDLRQTAQPLACVHGHKKAVSYVRWLNGDQLVTASTDNTLKLWSVPAMAAAGTSHCSAAAAAAGGPGCSRDAAAVAASACLATYAGHTNQRNFIGLAVLPGSPGDGTVLGNSSNKGGGGYIACGSETNEVYAYHSSVPVPITSHNFAASSSAGARGGWHADAADSGGLHDNFVSCVTWNRRQGTIVAANSAGHIKVLELV